MTPVSANASASTSASDQAVAQARCGSLELAQLQLQTEEQTPLLHIEHWSMRPGVHWVYGGYGSGKTRLLRLLASRSLHDSDIQVAQQLTSAALTAHTASLHWQAGDGKQRPLTAQDVFLADPDLQQWDAMPAQEVLSQLQALRPANARRLSAASQARAEAALLEGFSLQPHLHKAMYMLSTGTRRKVFLMAALLAPHPLVLLDEPSAALDKRSIHTLHEALRLRNRLASQVTLVATAIEHQEHGQAGRGHWALTPA